jgi:hypothetical protein
LRCWPRTGGGLGREPGSLTKSAAQAWVFSALAFALVAFGCRVCDRTLRPFPIGGPFPCQQRDCFNPARPSTTRLPVKCPLYARAIDIFGAAQTAQQLLFCRLSNYFQRTQCSILIPSVQTSMVLEPAHQLIHKPAHTNIHNHPQRQEHE